MNPDILIILFGCVIGVSLGLTGGGGSIFAVPLLVYGLGVGVRESVGISLAAVGATSLFGAIIKAKSASLDYRTGLIFAVAGMSGAPFGTILGKQIPDVVTLSVFAALMIVVGIRMWRRRAADSTSAGTCRRDEKGQLRWTSPCFFTLVVTGFLVGILSGIFGVGGGFVIVPALVMVSGMDIRRAVATSLMVIFLVCLSGVVSYFWNGDGIPVRVTSFFVAGGFLGMFAGGFWAKRISGPALQRVFAVSMWFVGVFVLTQNLVGLGEKKPIILDSTEVPESVTSTGRESSRLLLMNLKQILTATMKQSGPIAAIQVCKVAAIPATEAAVTLDETVVKVVRTSSRIRNQANQPDQIDRDVLQWLEVKQSAKEPLPGEVVTRGEVGNNFRYYRPLFIEKACLTCHGDPKAMTPELVGQLSRLYPEDKATGFSLGELRGVIRVDISLDPAP